MEIENISQKYNLLNKFLEKESNDKAVIKSNLMLRIKTLAEEQGSELDTGQICCKWCFNSWLPGNYSVILKPQKHPKKHMRSLLKRDINSLNKFQHKLVSKIKKSTTANTLVLNCSVCLKNTQIPLQKGNVLLKNKSKNSSTGSIDVVKKKLKKKKKDIFAGLNAQTLQQFKKSTENESSKKNKSAKQFAKKASKEISFKQQLHIHRALLQIPVPKKKQSQLATFLDNM